MTSYAKSSGCRGIQVGLLVALLLIAAGCRQADGPIPTPVDEQPNKISDLAKDLRNVASRQPEAESEMREDLDGFDATPRPAPLMRELGDAVIGAAATSSLNDTQAEEVARLLFVLVTGEELNARQAEQIAGDLRNALVAAGAGEEASARVAQSAIELQEAITLNRQRWYHLF
jgi:hypothetical protein